MTKRNLNQNELEIITGGATEIAEDGPANAKGSSVMDGAASSANSGGGGGSVDTDDVQQNQDLPGA